MFIGAGQFSGAGRQTSVAVWWWVDQAERTMCSRSARLARAGRAGHQDPPRTHRQRCHGLEDGHPSRH